MEQLKIRKLHTQPSEKLCLADGEEKKELGEPKKQLRSNNDGRVHIDSTTRHSGLVIVHLVANYSYCELSNVYSAIRQPIVLLLVCNFQYHQPSLLSEEHAANANAYNG